MRFIQYFILASILLTGCKNQTQEIGSFTLDKSNEILEIPIGPTEINCPLLIQYFNSDDTNYLAQLNHKNNSIDIYNLDEKKLSAQIKMGRDDKNDFPNQYSFTVKNRDTIILIANIPPMIGIMDGKGNLIKKFLINKENEKFLNIDYPNNPNRAILVNNDLYLMRNFTFKEYTGEFSKQDQQNRKSTMVVNLKTQEAKTLPLLYPEKLIGKDVYDMKKIWTVGYNNSFLLAYSCLDYLFITHNKSESLGLQLQTSYKLKFPAKTFNIDDYNQKLKYLLRTDEIYAVHYDIYNEVYYVIIRKREEKPESKDPIIANGYINGMVIILDKYLQNIGEVHIPQDTFYLDNIFITSKGIYISEDHIKNPTYNEDMLRYRLFELKKFKAM